MMEKQPTAGIILAAGMSTRMGMTKQLLEVNGKTLLARVVETTLASQLAKVILVLGHDVDRVKDALSLVIGDERLTVVVNSRYREGMASSLQTGLGLIQEDYPSAMFLLGDQPMLRPETINLLLQRFRDSDKTICVPIQGRRRGNPVLFSRTYYSRILRLQGDRGAREIVSDHPQDVLSIEIDDPLCFMDIDSAGDLEQFLTLVPATSTPKPRDPSP